jgi:hypothetical protein
MLASTVLVDILSLSSSRASACSVSTRPRCGSVRSDQGTRDPLGATRTTRGAVRRRMARRCHAHAMQFLARSRAGDASLEPTTFRPASLRVEMQRAPLAPALSSWVRVRFPSHRRRVVPTSVISNHAASFGDHVSSTTGRKIGRFSCACDAATPQRRRSKAGTDRASSGPASTTLSCSTDERNSRR